MTYIRENINGTSPQDINKLNENMMAIWQKVFGDIDFSDANGSLKEKICTQWIPCQGEGNFDKNNDLKVRFYIPPNTKKLKGSSFNFIAEQYRMDSDVALGGGGYAGGDVALDMSPSNAVISSKLDGISRSSLVDSWGVGTSNEIIAPNVMSNGYTPEDSITTVEPYRFSINKAFFEATSKQGTIFKLAPLMRGNCGGNLGWYLDLGLLYHDHDISHTHSFSVSDLGHTHSGSVAISIPNHPHDLNEGIKVSTKDIGTVIINVNGKDLFTMDSSNKNKNEIDISDELKIGQWNTISVSTNTLARMTIYGTIELITSFF